MITEVKTVPAKYVFLDVVDFSHERSVEAQTDIVHSLNAIVKKSIDSNRIPEDKLILLPTGDGICIALLNIEEPFDIHMRIALDILRNLHDHNQSIDNEALLPRRGKPIAMRKFKVRIGVNANTDNLVTDINGRQNIAGRGINMAQRVMGKADGGQIIVGQSVFDILQARESYMKFFRSFNTKLKHGETTRIHQFIDESRVGLNTTLPEAFSTVETERKLSLRVACYFAHALTHRNFFIEQKEGSPYVKMILLWMLASDTVSEIESKGLTAYSQNTFKAGEATFTEQLHFYEDLDWGTAEEFAKLIREQLVNYLDCFDHLNLWLINQQGKDKLKQEWPVVWQKFGLDES